MFIRFISKRLIFEMLPTLMVILTITFVMVRWAPGGPFSQEKNLPPDVLKSLNQYYGLDQPLFIQYVDYIRHLLMGDLGPSFKYPSRRVNELILDTFPVSLELGCYAFFMAMCVGIPSGIVAALRRNSVWDCSLMSGAMLGMCIPSFVLGPLLVLIFGLWLDWFNVAGWYGWTDRVLPAVTLGSVYAAYLARLSRGGMLEILNQDFIRTARAKGLSEVRIVLRHALKGGLLPVVSFSGPAVAGLVSGSFVVETIFQIPGLGRLFVNAAFNRDYTMVLGTVLFYALLILLFNLMVDILLVLLNPQLEFDA